MKSYVIDEIAWWKNTYTIFDMALTSVDENGDVNASTNEKFKLNCRIPKTIIHVFNENDFEILYQV